VSKGKKKTRERKGKSSSHYVGRYDSFSFREEGTRVTTGCGGSKRQRVLKGRLLGGRERGIVQEQGENHKTPSFLQQALDGPLEVGGKKGRGGNQDREVTEEANRETVRLPLWRAFWLTIS